MEHIGNIVTDRKIKDLASKANTLVSVEQILEFDFGPELWTIDKLIPQESITAITGAPASFKTWLTLDIAKCVARGTDFLGKFKANQGKVLIIDKENNLRHIQKRIKMLKFEKESILYLVGEDDFLIDKEKDFTALSKTVREKKVNLVIFDSLVRIHSGDENESKYINKVMGAFRKITKLGATVIFIHHNRKEKSDTQSTPSSIRGSSDIFAGIDCLLQINKPSKDSLNVTQSKLRSGEEIEPFKVQINPTENYMEFVYAGKSDLKTKDANEAKDLIVEMLEYKGEMSRQEILDELSGEYKEVIINVSLKELDSEGKIIKKRNAHNKHSFTIKSDQMELIEDKNEHNDVDLSLLKIEN